MHIGRGYRYAQPYTQSQNWQNTRAPARLKVGMIFPWSGSMIDVFPLIMSDPPLRDPKKLLWEWRGSFTQGFFDFRYAIAAFPRLITPDNVIQLLITDEIAGAALIQWTIPPDHERWEPGMDMSAYNPIIQTSGNFGPQPYFLDLGPIHYHEEPP